MQTLNLPYLRGKQNVSTVMYYSHWYFVPCIVATKGVAKASTGVRLVKRAAPRDLLINCGNLVFQFAANSSHRDEDL